MSFSSSLAATIGAYTGLSVASFFTILALMIAVYYLVSSLFVSPEQEAAALAEARRRATPPPEAFAPPPEPVQLGDITLDELRAYNGSDPKKPLLMAIKGQVYDVTSGRLFYGPGGPYAFFAGREASRALALMSFDPIDLNNNLEDLSTAELEVLNDWEEKFKEKYVKVGQIIAENKGESIDDEKIEKNSDDGKIDRNISDNDAIETTEG